MLELQAIGENDNTWGTKLNDVIDEIDTSFGKGTKSVAGGADVTLSTTEARPLVQEFTGLLTANINVIVPTGKSLYLFHNNTTGAFTLTAKTASGTGITVDQGTKRFGYSDGTNVLGTGDTTVIGTPSQITSNQNNYALAGANLLRLSTDALRSITGIVAAADGTEITLINIGSFALLLANQSGSSTAGNRFLFGYDLTFNPGDSVVLVYDATSARWRAKAAVIKGVPVGSGMDYWGTTAPAGYAFANGQNVSRSTYAVGFAVLSTTFGVGDGSTTFGMPDKRDRVSVGKGDMGGSAASRMTNAVCGITTTTLGAAGGDQSQQAHTHGVTASGGSLPHSGAGSGVGNAGAIVGGPDASVVASSTGSGGSQNVQPSIVCNYIIYLGA